MVDTLFTNGVIAVKEKNLLNDKLLRLAEGSAEDAFRALSESGFGGGAESRDAEALCSQEEAALDAFIREYASTNAELCYLFAPRDFHNAKALCKAEALRSDPAALLAPEGLVPVAALSAAIKSGDINGLPRHILKPVAEALWYEGGLSGAEMGALFDRAMFAYLKDSCRRPILKKLLRGRVDRTNILTAVRSGDPASAEKFFVEGGKLTKDIVCPLAERPAPPAILKKAGLEEFYSLCVNAAEANLPYTLAERALASFEAEYFKERRYALEGREPFLYYVFRRRAEIENVRIILICLGAGMKAQDIVKRLRAV